MQFKGPIVTPLPDDQYGQFDPGLFPATGRPHRAGFSGQAPCKSTIPETGLLYDTDKVKTAELFKTDKTDHYG